MSVKSSLLSSHSMVSSLDNVMALFNLAPGQCEIIRLLGILLRALLTTGKSHWKE
ncbi:hypothetical protein X975_09500, partial [Stegodyphus mimosarum]